MPTLLFTSQEIHDNMSIKDGDLSGTTFVFYNSYFLPDRLHIEAIPKSKDIFSVSVPFLRHDTNGIFNGSEKIKDIFDKCKRADLPGIYASVRGAKRDHHATYFNIAMHCCEHRKFKWAVGLADQAEVLGLSKGRLAGVFLGLGQALEKVSLWEKAEDAFGRAVSLEPSSKQANFLYERAVRRVLEKP